MPVSDADPGRAQYAAACISLQVAEDQEGVTALLDQLDPDERLAVVLAASTVVLGQLEDFVFAVVGGEKVKLFPELVPSSVETRAMNGRVIVAGLVAVYKMLAGERLAGVMLSPEMLRTLAREVA